MKFKVTVSTLVQKINLKKAYKLASWKGLNKEGLEMPAHPGQVDFLVRQETIFRAHLPNDCLSRGVIWQLITSLTKT